MCIITRAHAQGGKVIDRVIVGGTKITISQDLGTCVTRKHNESIELGEKLATVCFESKDTIHEHQK